MTYRKAITFAATLAFLIVTLSAMVSAQSLTQGNVLGTVTDPSGAVVSGATVTLKNESTGAMQTRTTNNSGFYEFALIPPGSYTLSITAPNSTLQNSAILRFTSSLSGRSVLQIRMSG